MSRHSFNPRRRVYGRLGPRRANSVDYVPGKDGSTIMRVGSDLSGALGNPDSARAESPKDRRTIRVGSDFERAMNR